ncbi:MAG: phage protease [Rhodoferax sp.]|uniref:phage protease n=1 Tax=Rhodoferax sp. TaxID=50421 RepID=UPI00272F105F|nr:phage protease [Rhodoferax sp.]MDP1530321.1 phage protease [Rhodoferax sp.]MDP1943332.1 phage protease [Rhodoferax sp.]
MKRSILAISARHFCLAAGDAPGRVRFLSQAVTLAEGATQTWVTLTRTGSFNDPRYGNFAITPDMLGQMVANFDTRVLGQDVFIDVSHKPSDGAAGKVLKLSVEGGRLRALVEWTPFGVDAIKQRGFTYLSAEYHEAWTDNEKQQPHGCVLLGAGLTVRPVIKNLDPVQLSDEDHAAGDPVRTAISPSLFKELTEFSMNKFLKMLSAALAVLGFTDVTGKPFTDLLTVQLAGLDPDKDEAKCLATTDAVKATAEAAMTQIRALVGDPKNVTITLAAPAGAPVDVNAAVQKALADRDTAAAAAVTTLAAKHKLLSDTIAEGDKTLTPEGVKKFAEDYAPLVTAESTDAQVKHLATLAVAQAKALSAAQKLTGLGYNPASGNVHISVDSSNSIKSLQATIDTRLGLTDTDTRRFDRTGGTLLATNRAFAERALAQFDAEHGQRLDAEHKALASGTGSISDVAVPTIAERTVLREALYNLNSLNFMNVGTAPFANVITIPYSYRDTAAAGVSALRRYEAQGIRRAGVIQTTEEARPIPQKLAFLISSELQLLMGASVIDFDPISENIRNIIRIVGEDTEAINMNELVNAADEYAVTTITDTLTAQVQGTNTVFVTTKFPVVKPRLVYDLKGVQVGSTVNPIVVTLNAVVRTEYVANADGSALAAGTYYIMDYNLGELRFVTEAGVAVVPTNAWVLTVAYSYSTNRATFDTDAVVSESIGDRYDRLLVAIGNRKVVVGTDRFYNPNMVLMSNAIDNALSQATSFTANGARNGNGLNADGSVGITKGMGTYNPKAPGLQLADTRIIVGERGNTRFRMVKPFAMNPIEQARDSNGKFTDQRESFGTQFVVSHTPSQIKGACSSIILFSTAGRVARVA